MHPKICDDSAVIQAVQAYTRTIRNPAKRQYAEDFWSAVYNESAHGQTAYPDVAIYRKLSYMAAEAVRLRIQALITEKRTTY